MAEVRVPWEDKYCFRYHTNVAGISYEEAAITGSFAGTTGIAGATSNGLMLDGHPDLVSNAEHIKTQKATGLSYSRVGVGYEYIAGKVAPSVTLEMGLNSHRAGILGWLLFQKGASSSTISITNDPPTAVEGPECEVWASIGRSLGAGTSGNGHCIHGAIAKTLAIAGAEGERMKLTAEMIGRTFLTTYNHTASNFAIESVADYMFFDFSWTLAGTPLSGSLQSFDISVSNNAAAKFYESQYVSKFVLGRFDATGTIKLSMMQDTIGGNAQIDNFVAGTPVVLVGTKGTAGVNGYLRIRTNMKYTGPSVDPAEEVMINAPFEGAYDGTSPAIEIISCDNISRGIA